MHSIRKIITGIFCFSLLSIACHATEKNLFQYDKQKINRELSPVQHLENNLNDAGIYSEKFVSNSEIENEICELNINRNSTSFYTTLASSLDEDASLEAVCCCIGLLVIGIWALVKLLK